MPQSTQSPKINQAAVTDPNPAPASSEDGAAPAEPAELELPQLEGPVEEEFVALAKETNRLLSEAEAYEKSAAVPVLARHAVGVIVNQLKDAPGKYGTGSVQRLSDKTGRSDDVLYAAARVAAAWTRDQIQALLDGGGVTWSGLSEVSNLSTPELRTKLLGEWKAKDLNARQLAARRTELETRSGKKGKGGKAAPRTPNEVSKDSIRKNLVDATACLIAAFRGLKDLGGAAPEDMDKILDKLERHGMQFVGTVKGMRQGRAPEPLPDQDETEKGTSARRPARGGLKLVAENRSAARRATAKKGKKPAKAAKGTRSSSKSSRKATA